MSNYSFFIGCDISKSVIDISYWSDKRPIYLGQFENNEDGFLSALKLLRIRTDVTLDQWFVCFENTGSYSKPFFNWLAVNEIDCIEENPLKVSRSLGLRRAKNDKIDSEDLCRYAFEKRDTIKANKPLSPIITKLKKLLSRRNFLIKQQSAVKTSLKEQKGFMDLSLYLEMEEDNNLLLEEYSRQIKSVNSKIEEVLQSDKELSKTNDLVKSVTGIGPVTAAYLITTTNNFQSFKDARKFASYCGVAPFPNSSGKRIGRMKVSQMANKKVKALLSNCILSAMRYDPQLANYYARKKAEGKEPGIIFNAIKNKLIQRVFAVIKRQTPYVKLNTYA